MTYLRKPSFANPNAFRNDFGLTHRDYEGALTTFYGGCGHDSISAAIIQAAVGMSLPPHRVAKLSGIGCSSKIPAYLLSKSHEFNSVHGRMPSVATGAKLANKELAYLYINQDLADFHELNDSVDQPFNTLTSCDLCPGAEVLETINDTFG